MARCTKAIFRRKWGLGESGLMAEGVVLLGGWHRVGNARLSTIFNGSPPPLRRVVLPGLRRLSAGLIGGPAALRAARVSAVKRAAFVRINS